MSRFLGRKIVFDSEGDNLYHDITKFHCFVLKDLETGRVLKFGPSSIPQALEVLQEAKIIVAHNLCGFDYPAIKKLYPSFHYDGKMRDTLVMSKLMQPERPRHSLESYGIQFNRYKPDHKDWTVFTRRMLHRCSEDVEINEMLYKYWVERECQDNSWKDAIELEQEFMLDQIRQEVAGVDVDIQGAYNLISSLDRELEEIDKELYKRLPLRVVDCGEVKRPFKKDRSLSKMATDWIERVKNE